MISHSHFFCGRRWTRALLVGAALLGAFSVSLPAAEETPAPSGERPQLSDRFAEELTKLQPILDKASQDKSADPTKWDAAINGLQKLYGEAKPESYDAALVTNILWQVRLQRGTKADYAAVIPLIEQTLQSKYFETPRKLDPMYYLAQIYLQEGNAERAEHYARRYLELAPKPPADRLMFLGYLLLTKAQPPATKGPDGKDIPGPIDKKAAAEALQYLNRALTAAINPPENVYLLKSVALQLLDRIDESAEVMELLVARNPKNKQYWQQLQNLYLLSERDLRVALTIERGQAVGQLNTPRDNLALVSIYYNMGQLKTAAALLEKGLADGSIESTPNNYDLLAECYRQTHYDLKAIDAFVRASEKFDLAKYDVQIAGLYYGMEKLPDAFKHLELALKRKEVPDRPAVTLFAVYVAFELKKLDRAQFYLDRAAEIVKTDKERKDYENLKRAVDDAVQTAQAQANGGAAPKS